MRIPAGTFASKVRNASSVGSYAVVRQPGMSEIWTFKSRRYYLTLSDNLFGNVENLRSSHDAQIDTFDGNLD
jgi:hypothetical protein